MEGVMSKTVAGWTPPKAGRPPEFIPLNDGMTGRRSNPPLAGTILLNLAVCVWRDGRDSNPRPPA